MNGSFSFHEAQSDILAIYREGHWHLGYRFLYTPRSTWTTNNGILILGMNPGGRELHHDLAAEEGNYYHIEKWKPGGLQRKLVQFIFNLSSLIDLNPIWLMDNSLTSNVIPFVSPKFSELPEKNTAINLGWRIWSRYLQSHDISLLLSLGDLAYDLLKPDRLNERVIKVRRQTVKITVSEIDDTKKRVFVRIPYLGHWASFCDQEVLLQAIAEEVRTLDLQLRIR